MSDRLDIRIPTDEVPDTPLLPMLTDLPRPRTAVLRSIRPLGSAVFRQAWRVRRHNEHLVPRTGPVILAANHLAVVDGPLLVALSPRPTFALAKNELFVGNLGRLLEAAGQIPIDQYNPDHGALRRAVGVLEAGHALTIFPEGGRDTGDMARIRGGVAYLAMVTGAPIVPVALLGTREPGQSVKELPRRGGTIHISYGQPVELGRVLWPRRKVPLAEATEAVRLELAEQVRRAERQTGMPLPGAPG
ncbi:1-acyl-sn-glycerol-3-phosphate acyltransferase [Enemella dayhoffiae]|uniref:1-acyl-sn-glycerol-3-phosphate acyltransferase n=1 Tax=Enemella dayhoffiae TaxID=2016507 RepID=A0A255H668_9ACTN|nr:lysophospholipid acyltransferase family protein [Enemella dayhoffiae]OYO22703.1 1-acyl-sn-glycerol-3-phosphate acyltransferase [Enemella dayhoffiae]